jgi:hypothetical protein
MKILLVDADSKNGFPNLALMKISAWYKMQGYKIDLIKGIPQAPPLVDYSQAYISCIFYQNASAVSTYARMLDCDVSIGGIGISHDKLPDEIEHIMPDYALYGCDFSMGFTSRGCNRKCPWCVVPSKEGGIKDNAFISEFLHDDHNKVVLMDNNFQASPRWRDNLDFIIENELKVNFNQGLDIRLVTKEFAEALSRTKYYSWNFKIRSLHFAFDTMKVERAVRRGFKKLESAGVPARNLMFYVLVGFDTTIKQDLYRVQVLKDLGAHPYIMIFNRKQDPQLRRLARWVNRHYYQFIEWQDYKPH